ncbi:MAG: VWA domain-containing protein [Deltaproteobacteria bacterium]|jgi:Ca-activated chloride channel family protein|nr:VWA domain-containing protein [Deltaproteobacteria bacterium]
MPRIFSSTAAAGLALSLAACGALFLSALPAVPGRAAPLAVVFFLVSLALFFPRPLAAASKKPGGASPKKPAASKKPAGAAPKKLSCFLDGSPDGPSDGRDAGPDLGDVVFSGVRPGLFGRPGGRPAEPPYHVEELELDMTVDGRLASATLRQTVLNYQPRAGLRLDYLVPLPAGGTVSKLRLTLDGTELSGRVCPAREVLEAYGAYCLEKNNPAALRFAGRGLYRATIFDLPPQKRTTLELQVDYLLPLENGRVMIDFPLASNLTEGLRPGRQRVAVRIPGGRAASAYCPLGEARVSLGDDGSVLATLETTDSPPLDGFRLYFTPRTGPLGGLVLSHRPDPAEDGYFLFLADALDDGPEPAPKDVVLALDCSGSMSGVKFEQALEALAFVAGGLNPGDGLGLLAFSEEVELWRPGLVPATEANRRGAADFARRLRPGGDTDIGAALVAALGMASEKRAGRSAGGGKGGGGGQKAGSGGRPRYFMLLTDGEPTRGETDEVRLALMAGEADGGGGTRIFSFGLGSRVNVRLLDRLSEQSSGLTTYVSEREDAGDKARALFSKMSRPVLVDPELKVGAPVSMVSPGRLPDLFRHSQLAVLGRYSEPGPAKFVLSGRRGKKTVSRTFEFELSPGPRPDSRLVAQIWAQRRVAELLRLIDQAGEPDKELVDEIVGLSRRFGVMTPHSLFLAATDRSLADPAEDRETMLRGLGLFCSSRTGAAPNRARSARSIMAMSLVPGGGGPSARDDDDDDYDDGPTVMPEILAGRAFFLKSGVLVEGTLTLADLEGARKIARLSPEYFELAGLLDADELVWLARERDLLFSRGGTNYLVTGSPAAGPAPAGGSAA